MKHDNKTSLTRRVVRAGGWQLAKRLAKQVPLAGTAIAIGLAGTEIRKKGLLKGAIHVGLDALPFVGTAKNVVEIFTGDLIPDNETSHKRVENEKN
jgi:hypothetical protein